MRKLLMIFVSLLLLLGTVVCSFAYEHKESYYRDKFCTSGETEVYSPLYGWKFDCVQNGTVYEFKHARNRDTALGQIMRYSKITGDKKLCIVLIIENKKDWFYYSDLISTVKHIGFPVTVKTISPE